MEYSKEHFENHNQREKIEVKEADVEKIIQKIPHILMPKRTRESLETEIKQSVFNLLQGNSRNFWERIKDFFEERSIR